jgi:hypothetical protein
MPLRIGTQLAGFVCRATAKTVPGETMARSTHILIVDDDDFRDALRGVASKARAVR